MIGTAEFNAIVRQYSPHLLRFARRVSGHSVEAGDVLQDFFETLWRNREKVRPESVKSFLFTVAHRRMVDTFRAGKFLQDAVPEADLASDAQISALENKELMNKGLLCLSALSRELVVLRDLEGYSYREIGQICELSESQVRVYLFRARKKLKEVIYELESV